MLGQCIRRKLVEGVDKMEVVQCLNPLFPPTSEFECVELSCGIGFNF